MVYQQIYQPPLLPGTTATPDNKKTGMILGSKLSSCIATDGFFSPGKKTRNLL